jgi:NAD(P)-dependent dehydrogenase (short-subunit alcohol dehydrogenase family)
MAGGLIKDRVAIVTGAAGGIGGVFVRALLGEGAKVALLDIDSDGLTRLVAELSRNGHDGGALPIHMDVADPEACRRAVERVRDHFGGLDILVNNAAIGMGAIRDDHMTDLVRLEEITPEIWQRFVSINVNGMFYMAHWVAPQLAAQGWGRVIYVTTSFFTMLRGRFAPYGPLKAAVEAMARGQSEEFAGTGVTVNVLVPGGPADTPMVPKDSGFSRGQLIDPAVMGPPLVWLCSDAGAGTTGQRFVAAQWDAKLPPEQAAVNAGAPAAWPDLAQNPVWPGGKPNNE